MLQTYNLFLEIPNNSQVTFESAGFMLPNPRSQVKLPSYSSDAMAIFPYVCGIADGVSQWKQFNINPKYFAEQLIQESCLYINKHLTSGYIQPDMLGIEAIDHVFKRIKSPGSSTVCTYFIYKSFLYITYIGDSQVAILRKVHSHKMEKTRLIYIYKSSPLQYYFNAPKQLIKWPEPQELQSLRSVQKFKLNQMMENSQFFEQTFPQDAVNIKIPVQHGDIILCGSDGFFDNCFDEDINEFINQSLENKKSLQQISKSLCDDAWNRSLNKNHETPFSKQARANGINFQGGKKDDITVIITRIKNIQ